MGEPTPGLEMRISLTLGALTLSVELECNASAIAFLGPSGSGKSTLLRILAGVEERAIGRVRVGGQVWQDSPSTLFVAPWERQVGWVPQDALLFPHLTVRENLGYSGAMADAIEEMAERLSVASLLDRRPRRLSGGEQQRVALGRALLSGPRLLLLDEPFAALDRPLRSRVSDAVRALCRERSIPLVLVSHDERDAEALTEEQWLISHGSLARV